MAIGGRYTVRGFDGEAVLMGERGALLRNEVALALGGRQELYLGADYGQIGGSTRAIQVGNHLAGAALGWRGAAKGLNWDAFAGVPLIKPGNFQTSNITFAITIGWSH
jgi:hemolysin activation/secretion protein